MSSTSHPGSGGLTVTAEMLDILKQPGYISESNGSKRLWDLYQERTDTVLVCSERTMLLILEILVDTISFNPRLLSDFGFFSEFSTLYLQAVESGSAPDLEGTETPFKFGYASLVVSGAQQTRKLPIIYVHVMRYLLSMGLPTNIPDIVGFSALHHTAMSPRAPVEVSRMLLQAGARVDHQNRYGEVPILFLFQFDEIELVDLSMEFGAGMDIETAEQVTPSNCFLRFGPQVTATVKKWIRRRRGGGSYGREEVPSMPQRRTSAWRHTQEIDDVFEMPCRSVLFCNMSR